MAAKKPDPDRADETPRKAPRVPARIAGATFAGGVWYGADGVALTDAETQQAIRLADAEAFAAREAALANRIAYPVATEAPRRAQVD